MLFNLFMVAFFRAAHGCGGREEGGGGQNDSLP